MDPDGVVFPLLILGVAAVAALLCFRRLRRLPRAGLSAARRIAEGLVWSVVALASALVAVAAAWNAIAFHNLRPPGQRYIVDGHRMRLYCSGSGSPTLVLDAGLGNDGLIWGGVQPALSTTTRVCSYDRAGFGWSDPVPGVRDADHIAVELHGLLDAAGVGRPIVLMGHSISGIYVRAYAARYPKDLAGLIFVDGSTPLQNRNPVLRPYMENRTRDKVLAFGERLLLDSGLPRLMGQCAHPVHGFDPVASRLQSEDLCHPRWGAINAELDAFDRSGEETVHTGPFGDLPILIFSQDPALGPRDIAPVWNQMQENLKQLSTRSRRIIAKGSSHYVQVDREDLIKREVPLFLQQVRGLTPATALSGMTTTE